MQNLSICITDMNKEINLTGFHNLIVKIYKISQNLVKNWQRT